MGCGQGIRCRTQNSITMHGRRTVFRFLIFLVVVTGFLLIYEHVPYTNLLTYVQPYVKSHRSKAVDNEPCPSVLDRMMIGTWKTRSLTASEQKEIEGFLRHGLFFVDPLRGFQKPDLTCGNISYYSWMSKDKKSKWFRVLCDPYGTTPCCYRGKCQAKDTRECTCADCYDLRSQIHAEFSSWIPGDKRCQVKNYTVASACKLLKGSTLHFYGDSLVRQMFMALVIILKGDYETGGLRPDAPADIKSTCRRRLVFPTYKCHPHLDFKPHVCNGTVHLEFLHSRRAADVHLMVKASRSLRGVKKSMVLFGCGIWTHFDIVNTAMYARGLLDALYPTRQSHSVWPRAIWSSFHYLELWRQLYSKTGSNDKIQVFNRYMEELVSKYNVSSFKTVNITKGVRSVDGTHYGPGINFLKAQIYLNYIDELQRQGSWG